jgi:WD40 repeat protein
VLDAETGSDKYALLYRNAKPVPEWQILSSLAIDEEQRVWATLHSGRHQSNCLARFAPDGKTWEVLLNDLPKGRASLSTKRDRLAVFKDNMTNYGGTVEIWDVASARKLTELPGHWDRISEMVFSADGKKLATVGMRTGIIKIWNLDEAAEK